MSLLRLHPWTHQSNRIFKLSNIFEQIRLKNFLTFWYVIKPFNFTWKFRKISWKSFYLREALPQEHLITLSILPFLFFQVSRPKLKTFPKTASFSNFLNNFSNFYWLSEKLPQTFGLFPMVKFRSGPRKSRPSKNWWTSNRKKFWINYAKSTWYPHVNLINSF